MRLLFDYQLAVAFNTMVAIEWLRRRPYPKLTIALTHKIYTAVSIYSNTTSSRVPATDNPYSTMTHSNVSMCQVEQNGLGPVDGGPPNPDVYSTACSCSDLIRSHVSEIPSPYRYLHTLTAFETLATVKDPNYLYVLNSTRSDLSPLFAIS